MPVTIVELLDVAPWVWIIAAGFVILILSGGLVLLLPFALNRILLILRWSPDRAASLTWKFADYTADLFWTIVRSTFAAGFVICIGAFGWHVRSIYDATRYEELPNIPREEIYWLFAAALIGGFSYYCWTFVRKPTAAELQDPEFAKAHDGAKSFRNWWVDNRGNNKRHEDSGSSNNTNE